MLQSLIYFSQDYLPLLLLIGVFIIALNLPAIILIIIGFAIKKNRPRSAKTLFIIAGLYILIGLGFCGILVKAG